MTILAFERPARAHRVARPVVHRPRPVSQVPAPGTREYALLMVREALDYTALTVAMSAAAPVKYPDLSAQLRGLPYYGSPDSPGQIDFAVNLAVEGVLMLGLAAVHNRAAQIEDDYPTGTADGWNTRCREAFGGFRRGSLLADLARRVLNLREAREWDNARPDTEPVMPHDPDATLYTIAPGVRATADELVSFVFGMWMSIDHPDECIWSAPQITGGTDAWFRATTARLWYESADGATPGRERETREQKIRIERDYLVSLLEDGRVLYPQGIDHPEVRTVLPMHRDERARLRFIELHLSRAFGFTPADTRPRRARLSVGGNTPSIGL